GCDDGPSVAAAFVLATRTRYAFFYFLFFFSSRRRHTRSDRDWSSDVCSSDLVEDLLASDHAPSVGCQQVQQALLEAGQVQRRGRSEERRVGKECRSRGWPYD